MARKTRKSHVQVLDEIEKLVQDSPEALGLVKGLRTHAVFSDEINSEIGKIVRAEEKAEELKAQLADVRDLVKQSRVKIEELWRAGRDEQDIVTIAARHQGYAESVQVLASAAEKVREGKKTTATERLNAEVHAILFDAAPPTISQANAEAYVQAKAFLDTHDTPGSERFPEGRTRHVVTSLSDHQEGFPGPGSESGGRKKGKGAKVEEVAPPVPAGRRPSRSAAPATPPNS